MIPVKSLLALSIVYTTAFSLPAFADEVEDAIAEALQAYQDQEFTAAGQALSYASQLILQKSASNLAAILPPPLPGWDAEDSETQAAGMAMMGGGIQASRNYTKKSDTVEIQAIGDSPLLAQWDTYDFQSRHGCRYGRQDGAYRKTTRPADERR